MKQGGEDEERGSFENKRRENEKRGKEERWNCDFAFLAAELKWATKGERDSTRCCVSACRAEASCWPPVSLAKNKPGWRGEDSSPLSICIFSPLSLLPSLLNPSHRRQMKMHSHSGLLFVLNTSAAHYQKQGHHMLIAKLQVTGLLHKLIKATKAIPHKNAPWTEMIIIHQCS